MMLCFLDFALKGHDMPAPGRGSGHGIKNSHALKGHNNNMDENVVSPFQGWADSHTDQIHRALPGAFLFRPLRGMRKSAPSKSASEGRL